MEQKSPAVFFDRDGVLNQDSGYLYKIADFHWIPGAIAAIRACNEQGYLVFVVTNQGGIARGYYKETDVQKLHHWMNQELGKFAAHIDKFFYCPHYPDSKVLEYSCDCDCRKPKVGMIEQAKALYAIDLDESIMIGDKDSDMECARQAGLYGIRFNGGNLYKLLCAQKIVVENYNK